VRACCFWDITAKPKAVEGAAASVTVAPAAAAGVVEEAPLPAGWEAVVDPDSGSTYYYNAESGESSWDRPT